MGKGSGPAEARPGGAGGRRGRPRRRGGPGWGRGGRGPLARPKRSPPHAPSEPQLSRPWTHSLRRRVRAGPGGGWRVCRSLSPGGPTTARPSARAPAAAPPLPVPLPLRQMAPGSPAPSYGASGWLPAVHSPSLAPAFGWAATPREVPALFRVRPSLDCRLRAGASRLPSSCIPPSRVNVSAVQR